MNHDETILYLSELDKHSAVNNILIKGYNYWYQIRSVLYYKLSKQQIIAKNREKRNKFTIIYIFIFLAIDVLKILFILKPSEKIYISKSSNLIDNELKDKIFGNTDNYLNIYSINNDNFQLVLKMLFKNKYMITNSFSLLLLNVIYTLKLCKFTNSEHNLSDIICKDQRINVINHMYRCKSGIIADYIYIKYIINKVKPKYIIKCDNFDAACLTRGSIQVTEFQHGFLDKNHYRYNISIKKNTLINEKYLTPTYFVYFGKYWSKYNVFNNSIKYKIKPNIIIKYYQEKNISKKFDLLWVCEGSYELQILEILIQLSDKYKICIKLHPIFNSFKTILRKYHKNFSIHNSQCASTTYALIKQSKYVLGIGSTCLLEASALGTKPLIFNVDESIKMKDFKNLCKMDVVTSFEDLNRALSVNELYKCKNNRLFD